jgi:hypothetical protein
MFGSAARAGRSRPSLLLRRAPFGLCARVVRSLILATATLLALAVFPSPASAQDPSRTATVYIHGFELSGARSTGTFGEDVSESLVDSIASLVGVAVAAGNAYGMPPRVVGATTYYGDTAPAYYSDADRSELAQVTAQWGGGVPRYALIVAKYARQLMQRSGAQRINLVSGSFGSLIARWIIEKNVGGLAGEGRISRWLSLEGILAGNWAASQGDLVGYLDPFVGFPEDVSHMSYEWVATYLHSPPGVADHPHYAGILVGQVVSTDDGYNNGALSELMRSRGAWQPNDGVQAVADARFLGMTSRSLFMGLPPTQAYARSDHLSVQENRGAWAEAATFLTQRRRVTVTMTSARVANLREPQQWFWDWRPAEVLLECRVYSPAAAARWGIRDPVTVRERDGAVAPMRFYYQNGETQSFTHVLFDDMVLEEEQELRLELCAHEVDYDKRYGVLETVQTPYYDDLGAGTLWVSTREEGTYTFQAGDWSSTISVSITDYPFATPLAAEGEPALARPLSLRISPNPHAASTLVTLVNLAATEPTERATLDIFDITGRLVRRLEGDREAGFRWDGRDEAGGRLEAGIYLHRLSTPRGSWTGRSVLLDR